MPVIPRHPMLSGDQVAKIHLYSQNELTIWNFLNLFSDVTELYPKLSSSMFVFVAKSLYPTTVVLDWKKSIWKVTWVTFADEESLTLGYPDHGASYLPHLWGQVLKPGWARLDSSMSRWPCPGVTHCREEFHLLEVQYCDSGSILI